MQNNNYLDKINKLFDNTESVTIIVTTIIIITIIVFILVIYNFLSKSSTNCNNIDKNYEKIFNIKNNYDVDESYTLNKSQGKRQIDISFSLVLNIKSNIEIFSFSVNTGNSNMFTIVNDHINNISLTSNINTVELKDLSNISFMTDSNINIDNIIKYFDSTNIYTFEGNRYFELSYETEFIDNLKARVIPFNDLSAVSVSNMDPDDSNSLRTAFEGFMENDLKLKDNIARLINYFENKNENIKFYPLKHNNVWYSDTNNIKYFIGLNENTEKIYIHYEFLTIPQNSIKYTYSTIIGKLPEIGVNSSYRDIVLINSSSNIEKSLNKIHNNYILTAFSCCNSGEYQNNYVDTCILQKCLALGVRCLDFQVFNYNKKPIIASSTQNSLYIKETFNYLELRTVLEVITKFLNRDSENHSPLFLHFRVMSLSENIYKELIKDILIEFDNNLNNNFTLMKDQPNINNITLNDINRKIIVFINPYYTTNTLLIDKIDSYTDEVKQKYYIVNNYNIYKSGSITSPNKDLILYNNTSNNYEIHKESHNKNTLTMVLPNNTNKINDDSFLKFMKNQITFICMKFQEVDDYLQIVKYIFAMNDNNSGFLLKKSIHTSLFDVNLQNNGIRLLDDSSLPKY